MVASDWGEDQGSTVQVELDKAHQASHQTSLKRKIEWTTHSATGAFPCITTHDGLETPYLCCLPLWKYCVSC